MLRGGVDDARAVGRTVVAQQEVALDAVDGDRPDRPLVVALVDEVEVRVGRVEQALRVERLEVDDLEALGAADAQARLEKVDRARLGRDVELLEHAQRLVAVGLELGEGRAALLLLTRGRLDRVHRLDRRRQRRRLDDADELAADAQAGFEEGCVRRDALAALERRRRVLQAERLERERLDRALCRRGEPAGMGRRVRTTSERKGGEAASRERTGQDDEERERVLEDLDLRDVEQRDD